MALAAQLDDALIIEQGATFSETFEWLDSNNAAVDISNYKARMQIRATIGDLTKLAEGTYDDATSIATGDIVISFTALSGLITLTIAAATTAAMDFQSARFDLELESAAGVVTRLVEGDIQLSREVTR